MLEIKNLTKFFGNSRAVDGLNLEIGRGELFGFVGPNGAGKTTTMKIIAGILTPDSGEMRLDGQEILRKPGLLKAKIGYMPDFFGVYDNLTVKEYMEFYSDIYKIEKKEAARHNYELLELVGLRERSNDFVDDLSRGMKQRLCLARTMVHKPELLILDEPASGMEPRARMDMKDILKRLSGEKKTILISSHVLSELAEMCTNIGIIEKGVMVMQGSMEDIIVKQREMQPLIIRVMEGTKTAIKILKADSFVTNIVSDLSTADGLSSGSISIHFSGKDKEEAELLTALIDGGVRVLSFRREEGNLEALFLELTKH